MARTVVEFVALDRGVVNLQKRQTKSAKDYQTALKQVIGSEKERGRSLTESERRAKALNRAYQEMGTSLRRVAREGQREIQSQLTYRQRILAAIRQATTAREAGLAKDKEALAFVRSIRREIQQEKLGREQAAVAAARQLQIERQRAAVLRRQQRFGAAFGAFVTPPAVPRGAFGRGVPPIVGPPPIPIGTFGYGVPPVQGPTLGSLGRSLGGFTGFIGLSTAIGFLARSIQENTQIQEAAREVNREVAAGQAKLAVNLGGASPAVFRRARAAAFELSEEVRIPISKLSEQLATIISGTIGANQALRVEQAVEATRLAGPLLAVRGDTESLGRIGISGLQVQRASRGALSLGDSLAKLLAILSQGQITGIEDISSVLGGILSAVAAAERAGNARPQDLIATYGALQAAIQSFGADLTGEPTATLVSRFIRVGRRNIPQTQDPLEQLALILRNEFARDPERPNEFLRNEQGQRIRLQELFDVELIGGRGRFNFILENILSDTSDAAQAYREARREILNADAKLLKMISEQATRGTPEIALQFASQGAATAQERYALRSANALRGDLVKNIQEIVGIIPQAQAPLTRALAFLDRLGVSQPTTGADTALQIAVGIGQNLQSALDRLPLPTEERAARQARLDAFLDYLVEIRDLMAAGFERALGAGTAAAGAVGPVPLIVPPLANPQQVFPVPDDFK